MLQVCNFPGWRVAVRRCLSQSELRGASLMKPALLRPVNIQSSTRQFSTSTLRSQLQEKVSISDGYQASESPDVAKSNRIRPAPEGKLSIVFTDIVKSTAIWENDSEAMATALQMHDDIIRSLVSVHEGYEVKQNGDGFMIAFPTANSALKFCLAVQQRLLDQVWPDELLKLPPGRETTDNEGNVLFRGLRLRMSAHWGSPICNWNKVIERMDYLGPVVNRAARFIQVAEGGQIVVSTEFLQEIQKAKDTILEPEDVEAQDHQESVSENEFEVKLLGSHEFKGIPEPEKLYFIIPRSLHGRMKFWPKHKYVQGSKGNIASSDS